MGLLDRRLNRSARMPPPASPPPPAPPPAGPPAPAAAGLQDLPDRRRQAREHLRKAEALLLAMKRDRAWWMDWKHRFREAQHGAGFDALERVVALYLELAARAAAQGEEDKTEALCRTLLATAAGDLWSTTDATDEKEIDAAPRPGDGAGEWSGGAAGPHHLPPTGGPPGEGPGRGLVGSEDR